MECQLCDLSTFWTAFWIAVGPALTIVGSLLLIRVALLNLEARDIKLSEVVIDKIRVVWRKAQFWKRKAVITGKGSAHMASSAVGVGTVVSPRIYTTPEELQALKDSVDKMRSIDTDEALGLAAMEAFHSLVPLMETLEQKIEGLEWALAGAKKREDALRDRNEGLRQDLAEQRTRSAEDKDEVVARLDKMEGRGLWPTFWAALLIPIGIGFSMLVDICLVACL